MDRATFQAMWETAQRDTTRTGKYRRNSLAAFVISRGEGDWLLPPIEDDHVGED